MQSAFVIGGVTAAHVTDEVTLSTEPEGESYEVLTADGTETHVHVRGVWLTIALAVTAPDGLAGAHGGDGVPDRRLWLDVLAAVQAGQSVRYRPDAALADIEIEVVPDLRSAPTLYAVRGGMLVPGASLKLKSRRLFQPGDPLPLALASGSPYVPPSQGVFSLAQTTAGRELRASGGATITVQPVQAVPLRTGRVVSVPTLALGPASAVGRHLRPLGRAAGGFSHFSIPPGDA